MCIPALGLYMPLHLPYLVLFALLNLYLHCGYAIPTLEWLLPKLYINTSVWHNKYATFHLGSGPPPPRAVYLASH